MKSPTLWLLRAVGGGKVEVEDVCYIARGCSFTHNNPHFAFNHPTKTGSLNNTRMVFGLILYTALKKSVKETVGI